MNQSSPRLTVVAAVVAGVLALGAIAPAQAQGAREQRRAERPTKKDTAQQAAAEQYPNATRKPAITKPSAKASPKLEKLVKAFNGEKYPEARAMADEIIAIESFNAYDHAFAARIAAQSAYEGDDVAAAVAYSKKAIELDGLDNNDHFSQMLFLAQLQTQEGQHAESLVTIERFLNETKSTSPEHLFVKGDALYNLEKYPEAIAVLKQALANSPQGATLSNIQTRLLGSYLDSDQPAEAVKMAEEIAAKNPNDKRAQMNLVGTYQRADQNAKASAALEKLRAAGQFTEDKDYRLLASTYRQQDGMEKNVIEVVQEGLAKGILKPDFQSHVALAEAYYYSDQPVLAIDAYRKAAPLDDDGETYLNLARLLWQENRIPEAKEAAKQALAKGVKKPDEAKKILALPAK